MTVGGVSVPAWPWAWVGLFLALYGLGDLCWWAAGKLRRAGGWLRDRVTPLLEDGEGWRCCTGSPDMTGYVAYCACLPPCNCVCAECNCLEEPPPPLAPERTWEQMTSHQLPAVVPAPPGHWLNDPPDSERFLRGFWGDHYGLPGEPGELSAERERRAPWWEAEQRQAYAALGLEFPSGLMARVREAAQ